MRLTPEQLSPLSRLEPIDPIAQQVILDILKSDKPAQALKVAMEDEQVGEMMTQLADRCLAQIAKGKCSAE